VWVTGISSSTGAHAGVQFSSTATILPTATPGRAGQFVVPK